MYSLLSGLQSHLKRQDVITDNVIFRIHCSFTSILLIVFSLIVTWAQFIGQPIRCVPDKEGGPPQHILNLYCWTTSTFTVSTDSVPDAFNRPSAQAYLGIGASRYNHDDYQSTHHKYHTYYQWTSFVLLIQAFFFYLPKWLWNCSEQGLMKAMVKGMQIGMRADGDLERQKTVLVKYLRDKTNKFKWYAYRYWLCEFFCLVNVLCQLFVMNWFFKGDLLSYGYKVVFLDSQKPEDRSDHMIKVFPRMSKCTYKLFGPAGGIETLDSLCILPLNLVNEKIYIFVWFWFFVLLFLTSMLQLWRIVQIFAKGCRQWVMRTRFRVVNEKCIEAIVNQSSIGTWWVIYNLGRNMDSHLFTNVVKNYVDLTNQVDKME